MPKLMCKTRLDLYQGQDVHVQPMRTFPIIKDLVTDVSWNYTVNQRIAPFTPDPADKSPWIMYQKDIERLYEPRKCIECFLCQDVCHVLRNHSEMNQYFGPRNMLRWQYLSMHPKDTLNRRGAVRDKGGIGLCNITKCCQEVCPQHIKITDNAIIPMKERVADEYFDPIRWAARKLTGGAQRAKESDDGPYADSGPVGTPQRPTAATRPDLVGNISYAGELKAILKRKDVRTADRGNIETLLDRIKANKPLTTQQRQVLWSYLERYDRLEGRESPGKVPAGD